jgi:hypothetical protein
MRPRTALLALTTVVAALTGSAAFDRLMANSEPPGGATAPTSNPVMSATLSRASRPIQHPRGAASRPPNRDMLGAPSMGGRGMRGMGGGRMNGAMRGRH